MSSLLSNLRLKPPSLKSIDEVLPRRATKVSATAITKALRPYLALGKGEGRDALSSSPPYSQGSSRRDAIPASLPPVLSLFLVTDMPDEMRRNLPGSKYWPDVPPELSKDKATYEDSTEKAWRSPELNRQQMRQAIRNYSNIYC